MRAARKTPPLRRSARGPERSGRVAREEVGDVAGDGDVALVGQAEGDQAAARALGPGVAAAPREEAVEHQALGLVAREVARRACRRAGARRCRAR